MEYKRVFFRLVFFSLILHGVLSLDICLRFPHMSACQKVNQIRHETKHPGSVVPVPAQDKYCFLGCLQKGHEVIENGCHCEELLEENKTFTTWITTQLTTSATTTARVPITTDTITTTEMTATTREETTTGPYSTVEPTTTTATATTTPYITTSEASTTTATIEPKGHCVYSLNRPAKFKVVSKRLYQGTPVSIDCQYPGVVGIFRDNAPACMGVLLDETTVLIDSFCKDFVQNFPMKALLNSYDTDDVSRSGLTLDGSSTKLLDLRPPVQDELLTVKLTSPVIFDDACVQPACLPNRHTKADDIDFEDCRFVGYGDTASDPKPVARLMEVEVTVDSSSVKFTHLKVTRKSGPQKSGPCFNDYGSPVICSHKQTGEWITVGMASGVALPCETGSSWTFTVENLLGESVDPVFFKSLQAFKYSSRP